MSILTVLAVAGLLLLWFLAPFHDAADSRRIAEQRPGDVEQLTRNLTGCLVREILLLAIAIALGAIALAAG